MLQEYVNMEKLKLQNKKKQKVDHVLEYDKERLIVKGKRNTVSELPPISDYINVLALKNKRMSIKSNVDMNSLKLPSIISKVEEVEEVEEIKETNQIDDEIAQMF